VKLAHAMNEVTLGVAHVEQRLSRFGIREEDHEVHGVAFLQCHPDLRIVLEAADAGAMAAARVDDHEGAALGIDRHPLRRNDAHQRVIDRPFERAPVQHHFIVEAQHRRQSLPLVLEEVVAALAQRVPEENRTLDRVDCILRLCPGVDRRERLCRRFLDLLGNRLFRALAKTIERVLGAGAQHLRDFRGHIPHPGKLLNWIVHTCFLIAKACVSG